MKDLISMFKGNYYEDRKLKYNFDIFQFDEVTLCEVKIKEEKHEIKYKDKSSDSYHSFVPQAYAYSFDFYVILYLNHKYINKIEFKLNEEEVDNDQELYINMESNGLFGVLKDALRPTLSYSGGVSNKKEVMDSSEYKKYMKYCREIEQLFSQSNNNKKKYSIISNICNCCGAMIEGRMNESVRCEYCKNKQMIKYR